MPLNGIYEHRLCAFVDILGFRDLVQRSLNRPTLQETIRQALRDVNRALPVWGSDEAELIQARLREQGAEDPPAEAEQLVNEYASAERGQSFSDSIVLSATLNDRAITSLVTSLLALSADLAELGVYVRGAVCRGQLCHEQDLCFGPALIEAYYLEKDGKFPRIVFSPEAYEVVAQVNLTSLGSLSFYLRKDIDDWRFLDFLNQTDPNLSPEAAQLRKIRRELVRVIRRELDRQLSSPQARDDVDVLEKLVWLESYFNLVLNETQIQGINPISTSEYR